MPHLTRLLVLALLTASTAFAQSPWSKGAPFPEPDEELYGVAAGGKMYVIGGYAGGRGAGLVYEYDPAADRWTKKAPMPRPAHHAALAAAGGKIYVFAGFVQPEGPVTGPTWEPIDNAWEFDPAANTWRAIAPLPTRRGSAVAVEVGGKIHVIGGSTTQIGAPSTALTPFSAARSVGTNEIYDPATNRWTRGADMPTPRNHAFAGAIAGKIYVIGGRYPSAFITSASNTDIVEEYDPAVDRWGAARTKMPTPRSGGGWGSDGTRIYVAGGEVATPELVGAFRAVEAFDPATNTWTRLPAMPIPRHGVAGAVLANGFHLVSGMITSAAVGAAADTHIQAHTASHDVLSVAAPRP